MLLCFMAAFSANVHGDNWALKSVHVGAPDVLVLGEQTCLCLGTGFCSRKHCKKKKKGTGKMGRCTGFENWSCKSKD